MLENERREENFVLLMPKLRRRSRGDENISLEEDPFVKLKMHLLGNKDTKERSFFRVVGGGVDVALATTPFAFPSGRIAAHHRCNA
jgi:hypothetical protein